MKWYSLKQPRSLGLRLWHWLDFLVISGLLITVLLRKTVLSWRTNAVLIETKVQESGGALAEGSAEAIAKLLRNNMWEWHIYLGYALGALILLRLVVYLRSRQGEMSLLAQVKAALNLREQKEEFKKALHFVGVRTLYAFFYVVVIYMFVSGLMLLNKETLGIGKDLASGLKEIHELTEWFFILFIVGHLIGIVKTEISEEPGIVSDMINGGNKK